MDLPFKTDAYGTVSSRWPSEGQVILASFTQDTIVLYQAYNTAIASWAAEHKTFFGCSEFSTTRMTWVKPNFLWMMYRSGWATKPNQERILAIVVKRSGFEEILRNASKRGKEDEVRLQWDPDHDPFGNKEIRRAIQLGLRGSILQKFLTEWIVDVVDITGFVQEQREFVEKKELDKLIIPAEEVFPIDDSGLRSLVGADV